MSASQPRGEKQIIETKNGKKLILRTKRLRNFRRESAVGKRSDGSQLGLTKYQAEFSVRSNAGSQVMATKPTTGAPARTSNITTLSCLHCVPLHTVYLHHTF